MGRLFFLLAVMHAGLWGVLLKKLANKSNVPRLWNSGALPGILGHPKVMEKATCVPLEVCLESDCENTC